MKIILADFFLSMDDASSHILPPRSYCFGKVTNYQASMISFLFLESQLLPIASLQATFHCSHPKGVREDSSASILPLCYVQKESRNRRML